MNASAKNKVMVLLGNATDCDGITVAEGIVLGKSTNIFAVYIAYQYGVCLAVEKIDEVTGLVYYYSTSACSLSRAHQQYASLITSNYGIEITDELFETMDSVKIVSTKVDSTRKAIDSAIIHKHLERW
jgi:hypothetical protein